jgi:hypothetical protein
MDTGRGIHNTEFAGAVLRNTATTGRENLTHFTALAPCLHQEIAVVNGATEKIRSAP